MSEYIFWQDDSGLYKRDEIVRCRDCVDFDRWDYADGTTRNVCARFEFVDVTPDGFCAWGERRG